MPLTNVSGINLSTKSLSDVADATPLNGEMLVYDSYAGKWKPTDGILELTKTVTITSTWTDTGIAGEDLDTGVYAIGVSGFTSASSSMSNAIFAGVMAWYNGITSETGADEIPLHKVASAFGGNSIFLRTYRDVSSETALQICSRNDFTASETLTFRFKRLV